MATDVRNLDPLVAAAARGDRDAFAALVTATSSVVSSISLAILRDIDLSREVAQDVFLAAWRDLRKLRNPGSFLPWLRQITRNRSHHVLRTRVRQRRRDAESLSHDFLETVNDPRPNAAERLIAREEAAALAEALAALPDETREVLTLFYREGQSVAQVAALLDLSEVAVKKRLSRARASLRGMLLDRAAAAIRTSAPGAAFTASVLTGLSLAAPATASAATALATSSSAAGAGVGLKALLPLAWALPGALGGIAGVLGGSRHLVGAARDDEERRAIARYRSVASLTVLAFALGFPLGFLLTGWRYWAVVNFAAFIAALAWLQHAWLPRIVKRRFEAEAREDSARALALRRRERRTAVLGWSLGLTFGTLGLILGLWLSG
jgi:RNA polymerase sigma factor (sigma-70 family)